MTTKEMEEIIEAETGMGVYSLDPQKGGAYFVEMGFNSDAGEDFVLSFFFDGTWRGFCDSFYDKGYRNFSADSHAAELVEYRGVNGVPNTVKVIALDAESIAKQLEEVACNLDEDAYSDDWIPNPNGASKHL